MSDWRSRPQMMMKRGAPLASVIGWGRGGSGGHRSHMRRAISSLRGLAAESAGATEGRLEGGRQRKAQPLRVALIGTGSLGSLLWAKLARSSAGGQRARKGASGDEGAGSDIQVCGLVRSAERAKLLCQDGMFLEDAISSASAASIQVAPFQDSQEVLARGGPVDLAVIVTKAYHTRAAANDSALHKLVKPNGIVLTLQNGMGNREELTAYLSEHGSHQHVVQGVTEAGSMLISYQTVKHTGHGTTFLPAGYPDIDHFATVLQQLCHDIESRIWFKLFVNSAINPLTALYNIPNGRLLQAPQLMRVAEDVVNEAVNVAIKKGVTHLLPGNEENMPDYRDDARIICKRAMERVRLVATRTAANRSSMLSDIDRGRPTEIDSINGYIARIGKELGVDISINRTLVRLVKAKEHPRLQSE